MISGITLLSLFILANVPEQSRIIVFKDKPFYNLLDRGRLSYFYGSWVNDIRSDPFDNGCPKSENDLLMNKSYGKTEIEVNDRSL